MRKYIVDENFSPYFKWFQKNNFEFVVNLFPKANDTVVWKYAIENNSTILTRDFDFYYRIISSKIHPKVVHFRLGNVSFKDLDNCFSNYWHIIERELNNHDLIVVFPNELSFYL